MAQSIDQQKTPWWLWPNLLSLDAPVVALAWAWMFAKCWGVMSVPWQLWVTLGLAVWIIYVVDRVLDVKFLTKADRSHELAKRHDFHHKYRSFFIVGVVIAAGVCLYFSMFHLARTVMQYGLFVMAFASVYFLFAWTYSKSRKERKGDAGMMKNLIAGLTFAYGASAGVHAYAPLLPFGDMTFSSEVLLFAALCVLNMNAIDFWNLEGEEEEDAAAVLNLATLLLAGVSMFIYMSTLQREAIFFNEDYYHEQAFYKPFAVGMLVGSASFFLLNQGRRRLSGDAYRVLVDIAVVAPVFTFWVVSVLNS